MSTTRDWLPTTREGILAMADDWISVCPTRVTGTASDPANKGCRIWYSVAAPGAASTDAPPPASPGDLRKSFFTKRKKDVIEFDFGDSGKTAYFAVQIENEGKKGPWGPLVGAIIP